MSAETFTTAMFLITAIIAAGVLVNAVFPIVYTMAGTFSSASHESDERLRTDFKIIATYASGTNGQIWIKNVGSTRISASEVFQSDVFFGAVGDFEHLMHNAGWTEQISDINENNYWDPGETLKVSVVATKSISSGNVVYFQFVLPNGVWRSIEFTAS
jgi:flagellar protein FlaG